MSTEEANEKPIKGQLTTWSGVAHLQSTATPIHRVLWFFILSGGLGFACYQSFLLYLLYASNPTETKVQLLYEPRLFFPMVTICNLNPIRLSAARTFSEEDQRKIRAQPETKFDFSGNWHNRTNQLDFFSVKTISLLDNYTSDEMDRNSHQLEDMLLSCTFVDNYCSPKDFTETMSNAYGKCYSFNTGVSAEALSVRGVGSKYGLSLELFVEQEEYLSSTETAGVKVSVNPQNEVPFPDSSGYTAHPGTRTSIAVKLRTEYRAPEPYSDCTDSTVDVKNNNMFWQSPLKPHYTQLACHKTIYQKQIMKNCGCCDAALPCNSDALNVTVPEGTVGCDITNKVHLPRMDYKEKGQGFHVIAFIDSSNLFPGN